MEMAGSMRLIAIFSSLQVCKRSLVFEGKDHE